MECEAIVTLPIWGRHDRSRSGLVARDRAHVILTQVAGVHTTWLHIDVHTSTQVDRLREEWAARGVDIAEPPRLRAWGMYEMRLRDPDGHVLRVSAHPSDPTR